jgi:predicted DNA-binding transcriptional regulator YafY
LGLKRTIRLIKLLVTIQSESLSGLKELQETLQVSGRTLYRDLKALREAGIPCYIDRSKQCYRIDSSFYMPPPNLTAKEALGLLFLVHKGRKILEVPFSKAALEGAHKIESLLPRAMREYCERVLKNVSVRETCIKTKENIDEIFDFLQRSIQQKQVLELTYNSKSEPPVITCDFCPLHLLYTDSWRVMGKVNSSRQIQSIKLKDIKKMGRTGKNFFEEEKFNPSEHLGRAWTMVPEGRLYNIKLRFAPEIADDVVSKQWHSTQYAEIEEDGSALLEFRVDGLSEITWWVISFADKVEVLAPQVLREKIHEIAANMASRNKIVERTGENLHDKKPQNIVSL